MQQEEKRVASQQGQQATGRTAVGGEERGLRLFFDLCFFVCFLLLFFFVCFDADRGRREAEICVPHGIPKEVASTRQHPRDSRAS